MSTTIPQTSSVAELCCLGELVESKIAHEISLIGHRMTWLVVSESFLFGAFALLLTGMDISKTLPQTSTMLLWFLPLIGISLVILVSFSLRAARAVLEALLEPRESIENALQNIVLGNLPSLGKNRGKLQWTRTWGNVSLYGVPIMLLCAWGGILTVRLLNSHAEVHLGPL
jgi:hypothetical protein